MLAQKWQTCGTHYWVFLFKTKDVNEGVFKKTLKPQYVGLIAYWHFVINKWTLKDSLAPYL